MLGTNTLVSEVAKDKGESLPDQAIAGSLVLAVITGPGTDKVLRQGDGITKTIHGARSGSAEINGLVKRGLSSVSTTDDMASHPTDLRTNFIAVSMN